MIEARPSLGQINASGEQIGVDTYLFVDLETGGLTPERHAILQLAAVITDRDLKVLGHFMTYIQPHTSLEVSADALAINQLKLEELRLAPTEALVTQALCQFAALTGGRPRFAGYNCKFDLLFLDEMWKRHGAPLPPYSVPWLDVMDVVRIKPEFDTVLANLKLASVAQHLGIDISGAHDASTDLLITIEVAKRLRLMPCRDGAMIRETAKF